jgi:hypothetical protein
MEGGAPDSTVVDGDGGMVARVVVGVLRDWEMSASRDTTLGAVEIDQMATVRVRVVNTLKDAQGLHRGTGTFTAS